jgi:hypothetical protein
MLRCGRTGFMGEEITTVTTFAPASEPAIMLEPVQVQVQVPQPTPTATFASPLPPAAYFASQPPAPSFQ